MRKSCAHLMAVLFVSCGYSFAADSDGDGLDDSVETNTGVYIDKNNTGTDPNKSDTDGDFLKDGLEVDRGLDPLTHFDFSSQVETYTYIPGSIEQFPGGSPQDTTSSITSNDCWDVEQGAMVTQISHSFGTAEDLLRADSGFAIIRKNTDFIFNIPEPKLIKGVYIHTDYDRSTSGFKLFSRDDTGSLVQRSNITFSERVPNGVDGTSTAHVIFAVDFPDFVGSEFVIQFGPSNSRLVGADPRISEIDVITESSSPQFQINEQFDDPEIEDFEITRQNISINNGFLKTSGRGTLVSKEEILGPKRIKMRVRPDSSVETFSLFIATNGESGGFAELLGLQATWTTDYSALQWLDRAAAQPELARLNMGFPAGQWLDIEILDYLTSASVIINGESRLDVDLSNYERVGNKIGLHSRELGGGSTIDYITVETLTPVSPAAPVVQLGALYESQSGEAIVIDATPAAGFPAEFTYQWCFNGFKIPANLGGTGSSFSIDSIAGNEGTWSVTVTNETGSVEQSFEYRIYADTDSDGLSDAFEELVSLTNINNPDTDNDGLIDSEEVNTYRTNPDSSDSDSDGFTDLYELETAYDPNSAESTPDAQVNIMTAIEVDFNAALGATYEIQFSTDTIEWTVIEAGIVGEGNAVERLYSRKDFPTGFFRVERTDQ